MTMSNGWEVDIVASGLVDGNIHSGFFYNTEAFQGITSINIATNKDCQIYYGDAVGSYLEYDMFDIDNEVVFDRPYSYFKISSDFAFNIDGVMFTCRCTPAA